MPGWWNHVDINSSSHRRTLSMVISIMLRFSVKLILSFLQHKSSSDLIKFFTNPGRITNRASVLFCSPSKFTAQLKTFPSTALIV